MYAPINQWTKEKIINHIEKNFVGKSYENEETCLYRSDDGRKCALGLFIPDKRYSSKMEHQCARTVITDYKLERFMPLETDAMRQLQMVHDESNENKTKEQMINWIKRNVA
jgi:hypothetical protein